jgi:hypothetical protein
VMDQILHGAKVDLEAMQALFESFRRPTDGQGRADATSTDAASSEKQKDNDDDDNDDDNGYRRAYIFIRHPYNFTPSYVHHPFWDNPFGNGIYGPRYVNPSFVSRRFINPFSKPFSSPVFGPPFAARSCGMRSAATCCPCPNAGYRARFACAPSSFRTCAPSSNTCARACQRSNGNQASDAYAEKLKQLETMGFTNRAEIEDLLRRYNGRMSRVVEILVRQRNGSRQTSSTSTRKIPIVDTSASSSSSSSDVTATPVTDSTKEEKVSFAKDVSNSNSDVAQKDETSKFSQSAATLVNVDENGQVLPYSL